MINPVSWPAPICQDERDKVFVMAAENVVVELPQTPEVDPQKR